ncbi:MAG: cation transporter [Propionibacteriaceae bacterium]|nr:cation transporter [Propionibacteriaceae bacterium]
MAADVPLLPVGRPVPSAGGALPDGRRAVLVHRVRFLVTFTIAYNVAEATVALLAGSFAGSAALLGFGLDSVIEVSSAVAVAWQFSRGDHEAREKAALRLIALSFFGLAGFVTYDAVAGLLAGHAAEHSVVGIVVAALSLVIMPVVSRIQRRTGRELGSRSAVADSKQTLLCSYMSGALLIGLVANAALGWWWADPLAALAIAVLAVREGVSAWRGKACCPPAEALLDEDRAAPCSQDDDGCACC